jgi:membrane associated rhomboid family serine protease
MVGVGNVPRGSDRSLSTRLPVLTGAALALTGAVSIAGLVAPSLVDALGREPVALSEGQLWRLLTSLLVQDGGVPGTVLNLVGLAVLGALVERRVGRGWWLAGYLGAGLVGEVVGWAGWQPSGAGNSVAVCGLAGVLAVDLAARAGEDRGAGPAPLAVAVWSAALLGGGFGSPVLTVIACAVAAGAVNLAGARPTGVTPGRVAAGIAAGCALVLLIRTDIHGAALAAGLLIGLARRPARTSASGSGGQSTV